MKTCPHPQLIKTNHGQFCPDCATLITEKPAAQPKTHIKGVSIAKIWER